jgi:hypothetical protein
LFHVKPCLAKQFLSMGNPQAVAVFGNAHANVFVKESRKMAVARAGDARECPQTPRFGQIGRDNVLYAMNSRMNVIAAFQPGGELGVRTIAAQINDQIARDCQRRTGP